MTGQPLDLDAIRARSENGSADWDDPITDARALLAEVDRLTVRVREAEAAFSQAAAGASRRLGEINRLNREMDALRMQRDVAEAQRDTVISRVRSVCMTTDGDYLDGNAEIPVGEVLRMLEGS